MAEQLLETRREQLALNWWVRVRVINTRNLESKLGEREEENGALGYYTWLPPDAAGDLSLIGQKKDRKRVLSSKLAQAHINSYYSCVEIYTAASKNPHDMIHGETGGRRW